MRKGQLFYTGHDPEYLIYRRVDVFLEAIILLGTKATEFCVGNKVPDANLEIRHNLKIIKN